MFSNRDEDQIVVMRKVDSGKWDYLFQEWEKWKGCIGVWWMNEWWRDADWDQFGRIAIFILLSVALDKERNLNWEISQILKEELGTGRTDGTYGPFYRVFTVISNYKFHFLIGSSWGEGGGHCSLLIKFNVKCRLICFTSRPFFRNLEMVAVFLSDTSFT